MFNLLSKTIGLLAQPLMVVAILAIASLFVKSIIWKKRLRISAIALLLFFTNPFFANEAMLLWEHEAVEKAKLNGPYHTGIVFTGMTNFNKAPWDRVHFEKGSDRLFQAIVLYKAGIIEKILITGGGELIIKKDIQEGKKLYDYCIAIGIPEEDLMLEPLAKNTYENARFTADILNEHYKGSQNHLLITSSFHMRRSIACMKKFEYTPDIYPVDFYTHDRSFSPKLLIIPAAYPLLIWERLFQEILGMIAYKLSGYI